MQIVEVILIFILLQFKFGLSQQTVYNLKCYKCIAKYVKRPGVACGGTTSSADDVILIDSPIKYGAII